MKIAVLIKQVPDTWGERKLDPATGRVDRDASDRVIDEVGERALEVALTVKDEAKDTEIVAVSMGPQEATDALRKALSMGADSAIHVLDDALTGSDMLRTATVLSAALRDVGFDLVLAGNESTDGRGGIVPAMIAEQLGMPALLNLNSVQLSAGQVSGERGTEDGTLTAHAALPAVVSVTERTPEARFPNFKGIMTAKKKPIAVITASQLGVDLDSLATSVVLSTAEREARAAGRIVVDDGNAAAELAQYLADQRLI